MKYGRYETMRELGKGSMGVVYQAHDPQIDRIVALKVLRQDRHASDAFVRRFVKEAKAIGRLSHPNIVTVYDAGDDHGTIYIAMEFLEGRPLNELIQEKEFGYEEILDLGIQVAEALHYAHGKGVIHRDIKPNNIVVHPKGQVKITDFGIAHIEDPSATLQTQDGEILGTPAYMSPEQVLGHSIDGRSDLFSLGVILYELSTGRRPFGGEGKTLATLFNEIVHSIPAEPVQLSNEVDPRLSGVIMKCLSKDPDGRYSSGEDLATALRNCKEFDETLVRPSVPEVTTKRPKTNIPLLVLLLALISAGSFYFMFPSVFSAALEKVRAAFRKETVSVGVAILQLRSSPSGAAVQVHGEMKGKTPLDVEVPVGNHAVVLSMPGYEEWAEEVSAQEAKEYPLTVELKPRIGQAFLKMESRPSGAEVFVDGTSVGKTPVGLELPLGGHTVKFLLAGHELWEQQVELAGAKEYPLIADLKPSLEAGFASVRFDTNPAGASVYVNDELKGKTPLGISLPLGKHGVRIKLDGFRDWVDVVKLDEEKSYPLDVELKPALPMGTLQVTTKPSGGVVYVDGKPEGKAPIDVELPLGQRVVRVALHGYEEWVNAIDIKEPREYPVEVDLKPLVGKAEFRIDSNPTGAEVSLDGAPKGVTPLKLQSPAGKHTIKISLADHQEWESKVEVEEGKEYPFNVDLKPLSKDALLSLVSDPPKASVYVDGVVKGKTPLRLKLPPGKHDVRMTLNNYRSWNKEVKLVAAQEYPLEIKLTPQPPRKPATPKISVSPAERPVFRPAPPSGDDWVTGPYKDRRINSQ